MHDFYATIIQILKSGNNGRAVFFTCTTQKVILLQVVKKDGLIIQLH